MHDGPPSRRRILAGDRFIEDDGIDGLRLSPTDDARALAFDDAALIVVQIAKANDGRAYSQAQILRQRGYRGRIRVIGDVLVDAVDFIRRAGIDELVLRDECDEETALRIARTTRVHYQPLYASGGARGSR